KVFSGVLKNESSMVNFSRGSQEKLSHISIMQGKMAVPVNELHAGDIGAVAKLKETATGDTLGDKSAPIQYPHVKLPEPAITFAIEPKSRADEDKLGPGIHKNYIPAVEKGIKDAAARGYLAGFPVVDFRVILYDGSYHDVDSNDMSFQMAGRIAFRKAMEVAKPTLLEPVMHAEITVPDEF